MKNINPEHIYYYVHIWEYSHAHLETGKPNADKLNLYNLGLWLITEIKFYFRGTYVVGIYCPAINGLTILDHISMKI